MAEEVKVPKPSGRKKNRKRGGRASDGGVIDEEPVAEIRLTIFPEPVQFALVLPISTRGAGFAICDLVFSSSTYQGRLQIPDIYAMYRVLLAIIEAKLECTRKYYKFLPRLFSNWSPGSVINMIQMVQGTFLPEPLKRIIDAIGIIAYRPTSTTNTILYYPAASEPKHDSDGVYVPRADNILLSNLRDTVVALASEDTPEAYRVSFKEHSPLPGAIWDDNNILQNPDDFILENYDELNDLRADVRLVSPYFLKLFLYDRNTPCKKVDLKSSGKISAFVSNSMESLSTEAREADEALEDYYKRCKTRGSIKSYWSGVQLSAAEMMEGQDLLLGEVPTDSAFEPLYLLRNEVLCPWQLTTQQRGLAPPRSSLTLSITTRGIGFALCHLIFKSSAYQDKLRIPDIYAMYRASLAITEAKLEFAKRSRPTHGNLQAEALSSHSADNLINMAKAIQNVPEPLRGIINAIGVIEHQEKVYFPAIAQPEHDPDGGYVPRADNIVLSNLRDTVQALANEETPENYRKKFQEQCPLPGAIWENNVLQNPDDFIPEDYDIEENLRHDIRLLQAYFAGLIRYLPSISYDNVNIESEGDVSAFVSNSMGSLRAQPRESAETLEDYYNRCVIRGNIEFFWSCVKIPEDREVQGTVALLGELPSHSTGDETLYLLRNEFVCPWHLRTDYHGALMTIDK